MVDPNDATRGRTLRGRYRLGERIGEGGMGQVFAAEDITLERRVAIKITTTTDAPSAERFRREALAAGRLSHPHIAPVTDYHPATPDEPELIVMELLEGVTLAAELAAVRVLPVERALEIVAQTASALAAAHAAGIVHRDIKPENLFLVSNATSLDFVKVLDFGVAKVLDGRGLTASDQIVGTVAYMSPEQAMGQSDVGPASDVFSLGLVLYRMLTGTLPHEGKTVGEILTVLHGDTLPSIRLRHRELAPALADLVDHALAFDRDERYPDGAAMLEAIHAVRAGAQPRAMSGRKIADRGSTQGVTRGRREISEASTVAERARPRRRLRLIILGVALAGAAGVAALLARTQSGTSPERARSGSASREVAASIADATSAVPDAGSAPTDAKAPVAIATDAAASAPRRPAPPVVRGIVVQSSSFDLEVAVAPGPAFKKLEEVTDLVPARVTADLRACYAGARIHGPLQADAATVRFDEHGRARSVDVRRSQTVEIRSALPPEIESCITRVLERVELGRWSDTSNTLRLELGIRSASRKGEPLP